MSRNKYLTYTLIILSIYIFSCTEVFRPEIINDVSILVVDGKITNAEGPYEIRLFRTVNLSENDTIKPERGAIILIYDDEGNSDSFFEISPGIYNNRTSDFRGVIGRSYWIEILTSNGKSYESLPEMIPPEIIVENIYGEETTVLQNNGEYLKGAGFYIDAKSTSNHSNYLRWEYQESWEWHTPYFAPKTDNPSRICYPNRISKNVLLYDGSRQSDKDFKHLSTHFINENEVKLNYNYFLGIKLYSVGFRSYQFWKSIQKSIQDNGGIYDVIPSNAEGNICACEENEKVIGYFEASSVTTMNKIFSTDDFEMKFSDFPEECEDILLRYDRGGPDTSRLHIVKSYKQGNTTIFVVRPNHCYDCNFRYLPYKPSFWP